MGSSRVLGLTAVLLMMLLPLTAKGDDFFNYWFDKVCEHVECGKGSCVVNPSYPLNFICQCQPGWKRTQANYSDPSATSFLPCVIPECTLNYNCQSAPTPISEKSFPLNFSAFDPCHWAYCGEGKCTKDTTVGYKCQCNPNYYNILNSSVFPCYSECTLGLDCARLGIEVANSPPDGGSSSQGEIGPSLRPQSSASAFHRRFHWIVTLLMSTGMVMWS